MIKDAINSAIDGLKKIRLDQDHITSFPDGVWALDKDGNILHDIKDSDLNKWYILIIKNEENYQKFYELNWHYLLYPSYDYLYSISLDPHLKSGIYYAIFNTEWDAYEFMDITDPIKALKTANLL